MCGVTRSTVLRTQDSSTNETLSQVVKSINPWDQNRKGTNVSYHNVSFSQRRQSIGVHGVRTPEFYFVVSTYMWTPPEFFTSRIDKHRDK